MTSCLNGLEQCMGELGCTYLHMSATWLQPGWVLLAMLHAHAGTVATASRT